MFLDLLSDAALINALIVAALTGFLAVLGPVLSILNVRSGVVGYTDSSNVLFLLISVSAAIFCYYYVGIVTETLTPAEGILFLRPTNIVFFGFVIMLLFSYSNLLGERSRREEAEAELRDVLGKIVTGEAHVNLDNEE